MTHIITIRLLSKTRVIVIKTLAIYIVLIWTRDDNEKYILVLKTNIWF